MPAIPDMTPRQRLEAIYTFQPVDHLPRQELCFWAETLARWQGEGLPADWQEQNVFGFDSSDTRFPGVDLGWTETPLVPAFEDRVLERTEEYEIIQDGSGRIKRIFKGRPSLAMPTYLHHAVASPQDWYEKVKFRLDPTTPQRWEHFEAQKHEIVQASAGGAPPFWVYQNLLGGYMYLRNMFGPEGVLYAFYDMPDLVHDLMQTWLEFMDYSLARIQQAYSLDEFSLAEDICYKSGMLISPALFREFLLPYYQELVSRVRARNQRRLYLLIDTDGNPDEAISLYLECGMDAMDPFEVAAGQDVVAKGRQYPRLIIYGGLDKRLLTDGADPSVLDRELERIIPFMVQRGGHIPTIDHCVPPDVPLAHYLHYREMLLELDH